MRIQTPGAGYLGDRRSVLRRLPVALVVVAILAGGCSDARSRTIDNARPQLEERWAEIESSASYVLRDSPTTGEAVETFTFKEVLGHEVDGDEVTWRIHIVATGRDPLAWSNASTLQVATCIRIRGVISAEQTGPGMTAETIDCPLEEIRARNGGFDVEIDMLD